MSKSKALADTPNTTAIVVDSMTELIAVEVWDGRKVDLSGFYSDTPWGFKRQFIYDATQAKTGHDGWSIINPDHLSTIGTANWYTSNGDSTDDSGSGCWVRDVEGWQYIDEAGGKTGQDCTTQLEALVSGGVTWIRHGKGTFLYDNYGNPSGKTIRLSGDNTEDTHIEAVTDYAFNITDFGSSGERGIYLEFMVIQGASKTKSGVYVDIRKSVRTSNCVFSGCIYGIRKNAAFGDKHYDTIWTGNDYGVYGEAVTGEGHVGFDKYVGCLFRTSALAAVYKDSTDMGEGGLDTFIGCIFEPNAGFGLFYLNSESAGDIAKSTKLINCWFESNASAGSVTINGTSYTPRDIYLDRSGISIEGGNYRGDIEIKNGSYLSAKGTFLFDLIDDGHEDNVLDLDYLVGDEDFVDYPVKHLVSRRTNREATSLDVTNRPNLVTDKTNLLIGGSAVYDTYIKSGGDQAVSQVSDGLFPQNQAHEITFTGLTAQTTTTNAPTFTTDKWYVATIGLKKMSGSITYLTVSWGGGFFTTRLNNLPSEWKTYKTIFKAPSTGSQNFVLTPDATGVVRYSKFQLLEFDTKSEAVEFTGTDEYVLDETYRGGETYKEGEVTPTLTTDGTDFDSVTYDADAKYSYTRTGNQVYVECFFRTDSVTVGSATGNVILGNLPYTIDNVAGIAVSAYIFDQDAWVTAPALVRALPNTKTLGLYTRSSLTATRAALVPADVNTGANQNTMRFSITYTTTDPL